MTKYLEKRFSTCAPSDESYRENWERTFARARLDADGMAKPLTSLRGVVSAEAVEKRRCINANQVESYVVETAEPERPCCDSFDSAPCPCRKAGAAQERAQCVEIIRHSNLTEDALDTISELGDTVEDRYVKGWNGALEMACRAFEDVGLDHDSCEAKEVIARIRGLRIENGT